MGCGSSTYSADHPPGRIESLKGLVHRPVRPAYGIRDPCKKQIVEWVPDKKDKDDTEGQNDAQQAEDGVNGDKEDSGEEEKEEKQMEECLAEEVDSDLVPESSMEVTEAEAELPATPQPMMHTEEELNNLEIEVLEDDLVEDNLPEEGIIETKTENKIMGRITTDFDFRLEKTEPPTATRPAVPAGELWEDEDFSLAVALEGLDDGQYDANNMAYRRPKELATDPVYHDGKLSRFDIEQGSVGTCYFLSVLQSIAEQPSIMNQIIPEGSYKLGSPEYDGVFHCRFWRFGRWVDVFIDDRIPSYPHGFWGAHNKDPNHMWVALLEKAFAKFHGSYKGCWAGHTGYSFMALTGGTHEYLDQKKMREDGTFCSRVRTALSNGSVVACSVPQCKDYIAHGLVGGHAYSITALSKIPVESKMVTLIRIRNPWGKATGEWTGPWSDDCGQWEAVDADVKETLKVKSDGDGEFWMTAKDYFNHFTTTNVCNLTPDADQDGQADGLDREHTIRGMWTEPDLGEFSTRLCGQKFVFEIPSKGNQNGVPIVIQLLQDVLDRKAQDSFLCIRADLFKVECEVKDGKAGPCFLLQELTNNTVFSVSECVTYRYTNLRPGKYMVVPYYIQAKDQKREFVVRIFTTVDLKISCRDEKRCFMDTLNDSTWEDQDSGETIPLPVCQTLYGKWVVGENAGGQIGYRTHDINPQYLINVQDKEELLCKFTLVQEDADPLAIGFMLMNYSSGGNAPMTYNWIVMNMRSKMAMDVRGKGILFIKGGEVSATYRLPAGKYMLIVFTNKPADRQYFLQINSQSTAKCTLKEFNVRK